MRLLALLSCAACIDVPVLPQPAPTGAAQTADTATPTPGTSGPAFAELARDTWSYLPVDGMACGNGSPTGIGVQPGADPTKLVVLVQGGGACWDALTCFVLESASHVSTGWGEAQLLAEVSAFDGLPWFDRTDPANPWADATLALVPYCTGDLHSGDRVQTYNPLEPSRQVHHVGGANLTAALDALGRGVPDAADVWAVGLSAGGYGVQLQADRFVDGFGSARVALLADGAPMIEPVAGRWAQWGSAWGMRLPDGCDACTTSARATLLARHDALDAPPLGLISSRSDAVIALYLGVDPAYMGSRVNQLVDELYVPSPSRNAFVVDGSDHVLLGDPDRQTASGTTLLSWVREWQAGAAAWTDAY